MALRYVEDHKKSARMYINKVGGKKTTRKEEENNGVSLVLHYTALSHIFFYGEARFTGGR